MTLNFQGFEETSLLIMVERYSTISICCSYFMVTTYYCTAN